MTQQQAWDHEVTSLRELQQALLRTETVEEFLAELATQAAGLVAGSLSCGMSLDNSGRAFTAACSDALAVQLDEVQYQLDDGPCLASMRTGEPVRVDDTRDDDRWELFGTRAAALGIRSVLALPLMADAEPVGALSLYAPAPGAFGASETRRAAQFAQHGSGALALASRLASYSTMTSQLRASLASRAVIDQALGVIMAQERCSQAKAFAILRTASQHRNIKLRELAREIVTAVSGHPPEPPPFED